MAVLTFILSIGLAVSLGEIALVCVDEEAGEGAIRPERVREEAVLFWVEDLQPHLVRLLQVEHSGTRRHVVVPCVRIKCFDLVLSVVEQPNGQVLICQSDVVREIIDPRDGADKLPVAGVVMTPLVQQDPVEANGQPLFRVAPRHRHGEGWAGRAATAAAARRSLLAHITSPSFGPLFPRYSCSSSQPLQSSRSSPADDTFMTFQAWLTWVARPPWITWRQMQNDDAMHD